MFCKNCGKEIDPGAKFCQECGAPVVAPVQPPVGPEIVPETKPKKAKKPFYKRWWLWVIVVIILCVSCGGSSDSAEKDTSDSKSATTAVSQEKKEAEKSSATTEASAPAKSSSADIENAVDKIDSILAEHFDNYNVSCEDGIITINVWEDGIALGALLASQGDEKYKSSWDGMVENVEGLCKSVCDFVDKLGLDDVIVAVNLLNDRNQENVLLTVTEGVTIYDVVNDA